jgi:hypothetical protein
VSRPSAFPVSARPVSVPAAGVGRPGALRFRGSLLTTALAASAVLLLPLLPAVQRPAFAQAQEEIKSLAATGTAFDVNAVKALIAKGDAASAAGNLADARRFYDQARDASRRLLGFYRDISGAFRGLDARIPREMDDKSKQSLEFLVQTNMRLAALFRRQGQPEVAVPLLVEVVKVMTPTSEAGRKAYQQLLEIGFVSTPWYGGGASGAN